MYYICIKLCRAEGKLMPSAQTLKNKLGEVKFRKKVSHQHLGKEEFFSQEYNKDQMLKILKEKVDRAFAGFTELRNRGIILSPFLEIGSGYGQAALLLTNKFSANGFATDLALEPLLLINETARKLKLKKVPKRLVCDAESLPFKNSSFPFIFCYQTLHHFKNPYSVLKEVKRVLTPGGVFFFAEEPVAQTLNIPLWYRPTKLRWWEKLLKFTLILPFISKIGKTEIESGILEESFSLSTWKKALGQFEKTEVEIQPFPFGPKATLSKNPSWQKTGISNFINRLILFIFGGGISGLAFKEPKKRSTISVPELYCPNDPCSLIKDHKKYYCPKCKMKYGPQKGILTVLPKHLKLKLYP